MSKETIKQAVIVPNDEGETPEQWARRMGDKELLERLEGYCSAALPRAIALEVKRRMNARRYGPRKSI